MSEPTWRSLTLPQLDFWEEFVFHPDQPVSTVAHYLDIEGPSVDERALVQAITTTIREAEVLSVRFREGPDGPMQRWDPQQAPVLERIDLRSFADPLAEAVLRMQDDVHQRLDLRTDTLSAQALYRIADNRYLWYIRAHHIIVDGYGLALIERRGGQLYGHYAHRAEAGAPFHPYADFLAEEEAYRKSARWQAGQAFWKQYLDLPVPLPVLQKGGEDYGTAGLHHREPLALGEPLRAAAASVDLGWPDLLVLLSGAFLHHVRPRQQFEGREILTLWLPFMSRWGSVGAHVPAMMVNMLPFHLSLAPDETLEAFLRRSATALRKQRVHGRYRIEQIATDQGLGKGSRFFFSPLINVLPFMPPLFEGCQVQRNVLASGVGDGLNLTFRGRDDGDELSFQIDDDSTDEATFTHHRTHLPRFIAHALSPALRQQTIAHLWAATVA